MNGWRGLLLAMGAATRARTSIAKRCRRVDVDAFFDCGGATTAEALATCVLDTARREACESMEGASALDLGCEG